MVEFALAVPILLMLLLGVLDTGRGVMAAASLSNAVREGARVGALAYPTTGWDTAALDRVRSSGFVLDPTLLTLTAAADTTGGTSHVTVNGTYRFRPIAPFITVALSEIPINASARMLVR